MYSCGHYIFFQLKTSAVSYPARRLVCVELGLLLCLELFRGLCCDEWWVPSCVAALRAASRGTVASSARREASVLGAGTGLIAVACLLSRWDEELTGAPRPECDTLWEDLCELSLDGLAGSASFAPPAEWPCPLARARSWFHISCPPPVESFRQSHIRTTAMVKTTKTAIPNWFIFLSKIKLPLRVRWWLIKIPFFSIATRDIKWLNWGEQNYLAAM